MGRTWREIQRAPVRDSGGRGGERVCGSERAPCDGTTLIAICKKLCSEISTKLTPKMYFPTRNTNPSRKLCSRWRIFEQFSIFAKIYGKNGFSKAVREISPWPANKSCCWGQDDSEKLSHDHFLTTLKISVENATRPRRGYMQILWTKDRLRGNPYP